MSESLKICHDRILPKDLVKPQRAIRLGGGRSRAIIVANKLWVNGSKLHVRFMGGTPEQHALVKEQAKWWTQHANLIFEFDNAPNAEIRITFDSNDGAWSWIGTDARSIPMNQPTMNLGFLDGGTVAHEFGHAIGLGHEHQNPDGGIEWNEEVVLRELSGPPNSWNPEEIRHNVLNRYSTDQVRGTKFDRDSIMLYFFPDNWVRNGRGTKENEVLSKLDKEFIASAQAYPRGAVTTVELGVNAAPTSANIGVPGEEDLFTFTATSSGRHTIETDGQTDVVMKLFGPNSNTNLIAEDDDGGDGRNSRIVADIIPGQYFVQIRHYNKANGTGSYHIGVSQGVELGVNAAPTSANIGAPGEEDEFTFTVTSGGLHTIETGGQTDVVMKLFGPDSNTNLIAEDDDGGSGQNSRIVADIKPGQYFVQIRHYNKANGSGSYTVGVSR